MDLLVTILIGVAVGVMVELILPGHTLGELVLAILLGTAGALLSQLIGHWLGWFSAGEPIAFIASLLGAIITLIVYGVAFRRHPPPMNHP